MSSSEKKYYAVASGKIPGIYDTWDECKEQVYGYKGAKYKSFTSLDAAKNFLKINQGQTKEEIQSNADEKPKRKIKKNTEEKSEIIPFDIISSLDSKSAIAYVDGSFDETSSLYSAGGVIITKSGTFDFAKAYPKDDYTSHANVAGEIMAVKIALDYCIKLGIENLKIFHDYSGLEHWATGEWKANNSLTQMYKEFTFNAREKINFTFSKIKSHSGDALNDRADELAKAAIKNYL